MTGQRQARLRSRSVPPRAIATTPLVEHQVLKDYMVLLRHRGPARRVDVDLDVAAVLTRVQGPVMSGDVGRPARVASSLVSLSAGEMPGGTGDPCSR